MGTYLHTPTFEAAGTSSRLPTKGQLHILTHMEREHPWTENQWDIALLPCTPGVHPGSQRQAHGNHATTHATTLHGRADSDHPHIACAFTCNGHSHSLHMRSQSRCMLTLYTPTCSYPQPRRGSRPCLCQLSPEDEGQPEMFKGFRRLHVRPHLCALCLNPESRHPL